MNVSDPQPNQFRCAKSRLDCRREQRVVASANPGGSVRCRQKRVDFGVCEKAHKATLEAFGWNRKYALDHLRMLRMTKSCVTKQRANCRQPGVARAHAIPALAFTMIKECADQCGIQIADFELNRFHLSAFGCPNPKFSIEEVRSFCATQFPELTNAAITGPETVGDRLRYTFERAIGSKG